MKTLHQILALLMLTTFVNLQAQKNAVPKKDENKSISVSFAGNDILINDSKCFNYAKNGNDFTISDLNNKTIIKGAIRKNILDRFESTITFLQVDKTFTNKFIVGRNDLIFSLVNYDVIGKDCGINIEKLNKFIAEYNEIK